MTEMESSSLDTQPPK